MTGTMREEARDLPVAGEFDICVLGGSCTGVFAAVAAARLGAKVALVERLGFCGGVASAGMVSIWHSVRDYGGENVIIAGLTGEVIDRLERRGGIGRRDGMNQRGGNAILHTEELKVTLDELLTEAGVEVFLHTHFAAPLMADGAPAAVAVENKNGRLALKASYFVDATGDADMVHRAGLPTWMPDHVQPPTTTVVVRGLRGLKEKHPDFDLGELVFDPANPKALPKGFLWSAVVPGGCDETMVAGTRVMGANCADADQLTRAEIEGRRQARQLCDILREKYFAGTGQVPMVTLPAQIGIRQTRHAQCLHRLDKDELLRGERFPDAIANGIYPIDIHESDGPGITFYHLNGTKVFVGPGIYEESRWRDESEGTTPFYQVPYRSLVPRGSRNVLVAGRCLDADAGAFGAVRVMVLANQMGQAAGVGAYLALQASAGVAEVAPDTLRKTLADQGAAMV